MKVAIVFDQDLVSQHFGQSQGFKIYDLDENKKIISEETIMNGGIKGCEIACLFTNYQVDILIVGGIGEHAMEHLENQDIKVLLSAEGKLSQVIHDFCLDRLRLNDVNRHIHHYKE